MLKRILTGIGLVAITTAFFFLRNISAVYFELFIYFLIAIGTFEITRAFKDKLTLSQYIAIGVFCLLFFLCYHFLSSLGIILAISCYALIIFMLLVFDSKVTLESVGYSFFIGFYPMILFAPMLYMNDFTNNSLVALLLAFVVGPFTDTFAFFIGSAIKGKKLCPKISPKKTISGGIGGLFGGVIGALIIYFIFKDSFVHNSSFPVILLFILIGFIGAILTEIGDLCESAIKRKLGVKDMGNILPGHGGILDRIDGMMFSCSFIYFLFLIFI